MTAKIYVASPLGFTEPTRRFYNDVLLPSVRDAGLVPLDPWAGGEAIVAANEIDDLGRRREALRRANAEVGLRNEQLLEECAGVLAVLDGTDVDSGTASEIGWAAARGRPVVAWRSDTRLSGDNEGSTVNLQVEHFIARSGGALTNDLDAALARLSVLVGRPSHRDV